MEFAAFPVNCFACTCKLKVTLRTFSSRDAKEKREREKKKREKKGEKCFFFALRTLRVWVEGEILCFHCTVSLGREKDEKECTNESKESI